MAPTTSSAPSAPQVSSPIAEPSPPASPNTDETWDDWSDARLPAAGEVDGIVQLIRVHFGKGSIHGHVRVALPETMIEGDGVDFCAEGEVPADVVGFGDHWQARRSTAKGWLVCDTTGSFTLEEWGAEAVIPAPTHSDGVWKVDFKDALAPQETVGLYRLRMEFDGDVISASDSGRVRGHAVTWDDGAPASAEAKDS